MIDKSQATALTMFLLVIVLLANIYLIGKISVMVDIFNRDAAAIAGMLKP